MYEDDFSITSYKIYLQKIWHLSKHDIFKTCIEQISFNCFYTTPEDITGTLVNRSKLELQHRTSFLNQQQKGFDLSFEVVLYSKVVWK